MTLLLRPKTSSSPTGRGLRRQVPWLMPLVTAAVATIAIASAATALATPETSRLFGANGRPLASSIALMPADPAHRSRLGLYATPEQFEWESLTVRHLSVLLDLDEIGSATQALVQARLIRNHHLTPHEMAYYVRAADPVQAARLADRLADDGLDIVFVIVPSVQ